MARKAIQGSKELAQAIRSRRNELGLTIEDAASRAGVGTKTWCRYEAGESIRADKYSGICKALGWPSLPGNENVRSATDELAEYRKHKVWSKYIEEFYGERAAVSFVVGSDILLDHIRDDLEELSSHPKGTHIGELQISWLEGILPPQFLMRYDYDFMYMLKLTVKHLRALAGSDGPMVAHSVLEELAMYLIVEESRFLEENLTFEDDGEDWDDWVFEMFDDMDIITFLYSDIYSSEGDTYHFARWMERQFYCDR